MLKSVLSPDTCAKCQNCCVFEEESAWELPTFSAETVKRTDMEMTQIGDRYRFPLPKGKGIQPCPFLDPKSGCTLPAVEKPFACSIWPLRVMKDEQGNRFLTLYQGCDGMPYSIIPALMQLLENGLKARILAEINKDEGMILPLHPKYRILEKL